MQGCGLAEGMLPVHFVAPTCRSSDSGQCNMPQLAPRCETREQTSGQGCAQEDEQDGDGV